jgi:magnesium-transporting ATPase (P-type)
MGALVQNLTTNEYTFYLKGADSVMVTKLNQNEKIFVNEETEILSKQGDIINSINNFRTQNSCNWIKTFD